MATAPIRKKKVNLEAYRKLLLEKREELISRLYERRSQIAVDREPDDEGAFAGEKSHKPVPPGGDYAGKERTVSGAANPRNRPGGPGVTQPWRVVRWMRSFWPVRKCE